MKKTYELAVTPRTILGKDSKKLRREHILPAVVYGYGLESTPVAVDQKEMERVYLHAGSNTLIDLKLDKEKLRKVFIHDVQRHPTTHSLIHVDFVAVNLTEEMTTTVPIVLVGESPAVAKKDGMLLHSLDHLQVRALPSDVPPMVEVDISGLMAVDDAIHVSDIKLPANVTVLTNEEELIVKINALQLQVEEEVEGAEEAAETEAADAAEAAGDTEN